MTVVLAEIDAGVLAEGDELQSPRARRFFRIVLGGHQQDDGSWIVPLRDRDPVELIERIEDWGSDLEIVAEAREQRAQRALDFIRERRRSYDRTRIAGSAYLGLGADAPITAITDDELDRQLAEMGWDAQARELRAHQRRAVLHALHAQHAANFSVPGAGKTTTALAVLAAHRHAGTVQSAIVVGPLSCFRPWESEAAAALPGALTVRRMHNLTATQREQAYRDLQGGELLLLSYPTAAADEDALRRLGERLHILLVVDEAHRVKRFSGGLWTVAMIRIAERARVRMILTGTPMPHSARDLWSQFTILWPGGELVGSRATHTSRINGGLNALIRHVAPYYTRTPKDQLGLEPYDVVRHPVEAGPVQAEIYTAVADRLRNLVVNSGSQADRLATLRKARPMRLLQAASNPALLSEDDGFFSLLATTADYESLADRLDNYRLLEVPRKMQWVLRRLTDEGEKAVVWTSFVRNIDQFGQLARDQFGDVIFQVDGRVPAAGGEVAEELDDTREERIDNFLSTEGFAVLIANPAACAESISLHSHCHRAYYLDRTYDCARWLQSIDRIHRLGLAEGIRVEVHVPQLQLDGRGTIDELVEISLARKEDAMQRFLRGAELRDAMLNDQDTLLGAEGDDLDLEELLRYLVGETA